MIEQLDKKELLALLHKRCTKCGVVKYFGEFSKQAKGAGGVLSRCRKCDAACKRKHYEKSKEKKAEYGRKYREENKEKYADRLRKYYDGNKEAYAERKRKRRAKKAAAAGTHTAEQVKARFNYYGNKCIYCGSDENLQIEHRIPLARGGSDWPANLAPACKSCNCSKGTRTETEFKEFLKNKNKKTDQPIATSQPICKIRGIEANNISKRRHHND